MSPSRGPFPPDVRRHFRGLRKFRFAIAVTLELCVGCGGNGSPSYGAAARDPGALGPRRGSPPATHGGAGVGGAPGRGDGFHARGADRRRASFRARNVRRVVRHREN